MASDAAMSVEQNHAITNPIVRTIHQFRLPNFRKLLSEFWLDRATIRDLRFSRLFIPNNRWMRGSFCEKGFEVCLPNSESRSPCSVPNVYGPQFALANPNMNLVNRHF